MATRGKRSRKKASARRAGRPAARKATRARRAKGRRRLASRAPAKAVAARLGAAVRSAAPSVLPISRMAAGWSTLRLVWRPAISMATLPYRVYRVYRWAEAESSRQALPRAAAP
jgi:hypothetical protein